jgi:opacity protein-like surface antigen
MIAALAGLAALGAPASADSSLDVRVGGFFPEAKGDIFADARELFDARKHDWRGVTGGVEFNLGIAERFELGIGVDGYSRSLDTSYRDYVRPNDTEIRQTLRLTVVPLSVSVRFVANPNRGAFTPYLVAGADAYFYEYKEEGDFIDFHDPARPIFFDVFKSTGVAPGFHVGGGLRVPLGDDFNLTGEARYNFASEVDMDDDFDRNRIDVSGVAVTIGLNVRF